MPGDRLPAAATASTCSGPGAPAAARLIARTVVPVRHGHAVALQLGANEGAELGSTVGSTSGSCSTWVTARPRAVSASAISSPM